MTIVTHDWNSKLISQVQSETQIANYQVPAGYVNATEMCKAGGKLWGNYKKAKRTRQYWQALANDMQIGISFLVIEVEGYGNIQGTWVHPDIAVHLAQWVSVEFEVWANNSTPSHPRRKPYRSYSRNANS